MSKYTKVYDGAALDTAEAVLAGADFDVDFNAIEIADATKVDKESTQTITGDKTFTGTLAGAGLRDAFYPVGTIYSSTNNVSPSTFIGGTWTSLQGKVLMAEDGTSGYVAGNEGGSKDAVNIAHTHSVSGTTNTTGNHTHTERYDGLDGTNAGAYISGTAHGKGSEADSGIETGTDGNHSHTVSGTAASEGVSGTDKNMPPYLAVYMWERTA